LKQQTESTLSGSFTEGGITYTVSANIDVTVMSEQQATSLGSKGQIDNLVSVVNRPSVFTMTEDEPTESRAYTYRNEGERFDRMTVALHGGLADVNGYPHEVGHGLGSPHLGAGTVMSGTPGGIDIPSKLTNQDFQSFFGSSIKAHMATRNGGASTFKANTFEVVIATPRNASRHILRTNAVLP
jgi:hypothetical protein